eukprot:9855060-Ditylum_brightwellii.AAC.1
MKDGKERVHPELSAMNAHPAYLLWCQMKYSGAERDGTFTYYWNFGVVSQRNISARCLSEGAEEEKVV